MKRKKQIIKYIRWGSLLLAALLVAGCSAAPDKTEDPLSGHTVQSLLPFATRAPEAGGTATQAPTRAPEATGTPVGQGWQNETLPGGQAASVTPTPVPQAAYQYARLEQGDEGEAVTRLQNRLIELRYMSGSADGKFGTQTKNAVKLFQSMLGLSQTGIATVSLQEKLFLASAPAYTAIATPTPVPQWAQVAEANDTSPQYANLVRGDTGEEVKRLQARLIELGYLSGKADGQFGSKTESAIKRFQEMLGLSQTGVATSALQEKLFLTSAPTAAPTIAPTPEPANAATSAYTPLSPGDTGAAVRSMQYRLKELGYFSAEATGNYYNETTNAVRLFQQALGLAQTGVATGALQEALYSASAPVYRAAASTPVPTPTQNGGYANLQRGDNGEAVVNLQKRLIALNYLSGKADGDYGANTADAVKRFQAAIGYNQTGVASATLQSILFSGSAPVATVTPVPAVTPVATPVTSQAGGYAPLSPGDTGDAVRQMQTRLKDLGFFNAELGGNYLTQTTAAVQSFQAAAGLTVTGVADAQTLKLLFSTAAPTYSGTETTTGDGTLRKGDTGAEVKSLQARLIALNYLDDQADGDFGGNTQSAVRLFQAMVGLKQTGEADAQTLAYLFANNAPANPVAPTENAVAADASYKQLSPGDTGEAVRKLQSRLRDLGYFDGQLGGNYLTITTEAVKRFQAAIGMEQTGVATSSVQQALYSASAPVYAQEKESVDLQNGDSGSRVKSLQARLIDLNFLGGKADGDYGANTENAVRLFQKAVGLPATGVADATTQAYLFSADAPVNDVLPTPTPAPNYDNGYKPLAPGDTGTAVKQMQARLKELGYFDGELGGNYLAKTTAAVKLFQAAIGMSQTGEASAEMLKLLYSDVAPSYLSTSATDQYAVLRQGDSGTQVKRLQTRLLALGWLQSEDGADGHYGANTASAVSEFQYRMGLTADGVASIELQEYLYADVAPQYVKYIDLKYGDMKEEVILLQTRLIELGLLDAKADGDYGERTAEAVRLAQTLLGYAQNTIDGQTATKEFQRELFSENALKIALAAAG